MSNQVFPSLVKGLTFTVMKTPEFASIVQSAPNFVELRIAQAQNPKWHWTLIYDYLYDSWPGPNNTKPYAPWTDLQTLLGFFLARQGQFDDWLYSDPDDNFIGPGLVGGVANPQAQIALVSDGAGNYYSPIQRNMGGQFFEDITDLNGAILVYANGILQTSGYSLLAGGLALPGVSWAGLSLEWAAQPTPPITVSCSYYFRVRFEADSQDFEKFMAGLWTIGGSDAKNGSGMLKFQSARLPAAALGNARSFNGYDSVDFGAPSSLFITGDWSFGAWIKIPANGHGTIIGFGNGGSSAPGAQFPYLLAIEGGPATFSIEYGQDVGNNTTVTNGPYISYATNIPVNTWVYLGASRVAGTSVTLYVGQGTTLGSGIVEAYTQVLTLSNFSLVTAAGSQCQLGSMHGIPASTPGSTLWYPGYSIMADAYMWSRALSSAEHLAAMHGSPSATGLVLAISDLAMGQNPVPSFAGGLAGAVNGTTRVMGHV